MWRTWADGAVFSATIWQQFGGYALKGILFEAGFIKIMVIGLGRGLLLSCKYSNQPVPKMQVLCGWRGKIH